MQHFFFQRQQRLLNAFDFKQVFDCVDHRVGNRSFLILARETELPQPGRLGLVVAKKNIRKAVDRNRFKRTVRNRFRLMQHQLTGLDIVVLARSGFNTESRDQLDLNLEKSLLKLAAKRYKESA